MGSKQGKTTFTVELTVLMLIYERCLQSFTDKQISMRNNESLIVGLLADSVLKLIFLLNIMKTENFPHFSTVIFHAELI